MYQVGDKIVYPLHGAGIIAAIEEKEILGEKKEYYIIKMIIGKIQMMIPIEKTEQVGIRAIISEDQMEDVFLTFHEGESDSFSIWNQRYRVNAEKVSSGDFYKVAEVIRDLTRLNKVKSLGTGEKKMLDNAMRILISEMELVREIDEKQATLFLDQIVNN